MAKGKITKDNGKKELTRYQKIQAGMEKPQGSEKGWKNLEKRTSFNQMDAERRREICRKGAEAVHKLHGEKKTARQSLEKILTLKLTDDIIDGANISPDIAERLKRDNPNATLYDLINLVAVGRAVGGSIAAATFVRDTHGDKPVDKVEVTDNVTTDADRALMQRIADRLDNAERIEIVADITPTDVKTTDTGTG